MDNEKKKCKNFEEKIDYLLNSKKLDQDNYLKTIEELKNNHEIKMKELLMAKTQLEEIYHEFIHVEFISENIFGVLYEGNLSYLGEDIENISDIDGKNIIIIIS